MGSYTTQKILTHNGKAVTLNGDKLLKKTDIVSYPSSVTGGAKTVDGEYTYITFTVSNESQNLVIDSGQLSVDYIIVGGGGGGGGGAISDTYTQYTTAGSGGAGGGVIAGSMSIPAGTYDIEVGTNGNGAPSVFGAGATYATSGGHSSAFGLTAIGGGGGVGLDSANFNGASGLNGGSGGGAVCGNNGAINGGTGTSGQGRNGGNASNARRGVGGGGGATSAGENGGFSKSGNGGNGYTWVNGKTYGCGAPGGQCELASAGSFPAGYEYEIGSGNGGAGGKAVYPNKYGGSVGHSGTVIIRYKTSDVHP